MVSDAVLKGKTFESKGAEIAALQAYKNDSSAQAGRELHARLNALNPRDMDDASLRRIATVALDMLKDSHIALEDANHQIALQRGRIEHLEALATTDELTGLTNRRGFVDAFERELDRTTRGLTKGGLLLMIDLDNFKLINDTHGHAAGDAALRLVSETLKSAIRRMDLAGRLGGDEFVLMFSNADVMAAVDRAQHLAIRLNSLVLRWKGERIPVRASIGMRPYAGGDTAEGVMQGADSSMYAVKLGRAQMKKDTAKKENALV
ncbi:MAG TPA: GGDEF domain-containing protein [Alphaproteobacteria bacterium]